MDRICRAGWRTQLSGKREMFGQVPTKPGKALNVELIISAPNGPKTASQAVPQASLPLRPQVLGLSSSIGYL